MSGGRQKSQRVCAQLLQVTDIHGFEVFAVTTVIEALSEETWELVITQQSKVCSGDSCQTCLN